MKGMDEKFWRDWEKNRDLMKRCDMLQKIDRLSYDHAVAWMENAKEQGRNEEYKRITTNMEHGIVPVEFSKILNKNFERIFRDLEEGYHICKDEGVCCEDCVLGSENGIADCPCYQAFKQKYVEKKK